MIATYQIAMAAARDAANRNMREAARTAWNADDWMIALETVEKLLKDTLTSD